MFCRCATVRCRRRAGRQRRRYRRRDKERTADRDGAIPLVVPTDGEERGREERDQREAAAESGTGGVRVSRFVGSGVEGGGLLVAPRIPAVGLGLRRLFPEVTVTFALTVTAPSPEVYGSSALR